MVEWVLILWTLLTRRSNNKHYFFICFLNFKKSKYLLYSVSDIMGPRHRYNYYVYKSTKQQEHHDFWQILQEMWTDFKYQGVNSVEYSRKRLWGLRVSFSGHRRQSIPPRSVAVFVNGRRKPTLKSLKTHQVSYRLWAPKERPHSLSSALCSVFLLYSGKFLPFSSQGHFWELFTHANLNL